MTDFPTTPLSLQAWRVLQDAPCEVVEYFATDAYGDPWVMRDAVVREQCGIMRLKAVWSHGAPESLDGWTKNQNPFHT